MSEENRSRKKFNDAQRPEGNLGNARERLEIASGYGLLIDQFMLGNDQFFTKLAEDCGEFSDISSVRDPLAAAVASFGGSLVEIPRGTYSIFRDPERALIVIYSGAGEQEAFDVEALFASRDEARCLGRVFVDTRCLALIDANALCNPELLTKYQTLRRQGEEKSARDLIRQNGGAVRYGFRKYGDELGVFSIPSWNVIALWPDVILDA